MPPEPDVTAYPSAEPAPAGGAQWQALLDGDTTALAQWPDDPLVSLYAPLCAGGPDRALVVGHLGHRQALAPEGNHLCGNEVPRLPGISLQVSVMSLGLLLRLERGEEFLGRVRHRIGGRMRPD